MPEFSVTIIFSLVRQTGPIERPELIEIFQNFLDLIDTTNFLDLIDTEIFQNFLDLIDTTNTCPTRECRTSH